MARGRFKYSHVCRHNIYYCNVILHSFPFISAASDVIINIMGKRLRLILIAPLAAMLCLCACAAQEEPEPLIIEAPLITAVPAFVAPVMPSPTPQASAPLDLVPSETPFERDDALSVTRGEYTIAWLSDTQYYSRDNPDIFVRITRFLRDNASRMNLKYIVHTGDLVHDYSSKEQWDNAEAAMQRIRGIPHGVLAGNHDIGTSKRDFNEFIARFGIGTMRKHDYCGGIYKDGQGHYDIIPVGETRLLFVYMSYAPNADALKWVDDVFKQYPDCVGILCLHDYFRSDLSLYSVAEEIQSSILPSNPNIYMVLCGHRYNVACVPFPCDDDGDGKDDRIVYQLMANYQEAGEGGSGYIRFFQIDEENGEMRLYAYSPYLKDYNLFDNEGLTYTHYNVAAENETLVLDIPWQDSH